MSETGRLSACCHACSRTQNGLSLVSSQCTSGSKQSWCRWEVMYCIKYSTSTPYLFSIGVSMIERPLTDKGGNLYYISVVHTRTGRLLPGLPADRTLLRACTYCTYYVLVQVPTMSLQATCRSFAHGRGTCGKICPFFFFFFLFARR